MKPYFSVVIPTLNEESYIPSLLDSLLKQVFQSFEIIIIDGNSTDKTKDIINSYSAQFKNKKVDLNFHTSQKRNAAFQRNMGAKKAHGEYLVFFDADIQCPSNYLSFLHSYIKTHNIHLITTKVKADRQGMYELITQILVNLLIQISITIGKQLSPGFNTIVRKDVFFDVGGFDPTVNVIDDYDFSLRALQKGFHLGLMKKATITFSLRRFRKGGWLETFYDYVKITIYTLIHGVPKRKVFVYPMGGQAHKK